MARRPRDPFVRTIRAAVTPDFAVTTPMRDAESNTRPRFALPAGSCDSHFHVFEAGYPHIARPLYTFPDATLDQYLRMAQVLGLERMVLVQPTYYGTDNRLTLDVLRRVGPSCRAVVQIEEDSSDAELDGYHELGVRAIRLDLFARAGWPIEDLVSYIRRMASRARPRGWHLQFYSPGTVVRDLLSFLGDLESRLVIDHMGYMLEADGLTDADFDRLLETLEQGNCWVKLSGAYRIAKSRPLSSVEPRGRALVAARPDRLIWGSDWPHLPDGQRDTGELLNLLADWAPSARDRRRILVESPDELFFADEA
jgi:2-pyrone-4,6-dicarboxylate lactonase